MSNTQLSPTASPPYSSSRWHRIRETIRAPLAEFFGVLVFVLIGTAADCQAILSSNQQVSPISKGTFLSLGFGWATGAALGTWICAGISGGHINPAMTIALATWRGFPWKQVPVYITAQVLGGLAGSAIAYGQYLQAIDIFEGSHDIRTRATAGLFATFPLEYMAGFPTFTSEFLGTAILAFMIMVTLDKHNSALDKSLFPLALFIIVLALGVALGMQTYSFNPARDFGCRLFLSMAGYGAPLYTYHSHYWIWGPIVGPIVGAVFGIGLYDLVLRKIDVEGAAGHVQGDIEKSDF